VPNERCQLSSFDLDGATALCDQEAAYLLWREGVAVAICAGCARGAEQWIQGGLVHTDASAARMNARLETLPA